MCVLPRSGAIAQLGERLLCKQEVVGSIPSGSTTSCVEHAGFLFVRESHSARFVVDEACVLSDIVKRRS